MTQIIKQQVLTDPQGRILSRTVERLMDGPGGTSVVRTTSGARCCGCWRPVAEAGQLAGRCAWCGHGPLCTACEVSCGVCGRKTCSRCRHGFVWGRAPMAACPPCYRRLNRRAVHEHHLAAQRARFLMAVQRHREQIRSTAMRLQMLRMGAAFPAQRRPSHAVRR